MKIKMFLLYGTLMISNITNINAMQINLSEIPGQTSPDEPIILSRDLRANPLTFSSSTFITSQTASQERIDFVMRGQNVARICSIDGGGIRGIIPILQCQTLESFTGQKMHQMFHMFAGTSTGGIIAAGYNIKNPENPLDALYNSEDLQDIYYTQGENIFRKRFFNWFGLGVAKYSSESAYETFSRYAGNTKLSELLNDVLIPYYDLSLPEPKFFKNYIANNSIHQTRADYYLKDVWAATTAAPTYFRPAIIRTIDNILHNRDVHVTTSDGGLFANNPVNCAFSDAIRLYSNADAYMILSMGTGKCVSSSTPNSLLAWAYAIPDILMNNTAVMTEHQLKATGTIYNKPVIYCRTQVDLDIAYSKMDNISPENLSALAERATPDNIIHKLATISTGLRHPKTDRDILTTTREEESNFYVIQ